MASIEMCGVLVHVRPDKANRARDLIAAMRGVEVHALTEDGRMVVTIEEQEGEELMTSTMKDFHDVDGVLSASLIYEHSESAEDQEPA